MPNWWDDPLYAAPARLPDLWNSPPAAGDPAAVSPSATPPLGPGLAPLPLDRLRQLTASLPDPPRLPKPTRQETGGFFQTALDTASALGSGAARGAAGLGPALYSLADIATGGYLDRGRRSLQASLQNVAADATGDENLRVRPEDITPFAAGTQQAQAAISSPLETDRVQRQRAEMGQRALDWGYVKDVVTDPVNMAGMIGESLPYMLGITAPAGAARAAALARGASAERAAKIGERVAIGMNAPISGGTSALGAQEQIHAMPADQLAAQFPDYAALRQQGVSDADARARIAQTAGSKTAAVSGSLGTLASILTKGGAEGALMRALGGEGSRSIVNGLLKGALGEGAEEYLQSGGEKIGENVGMDQPMMRGVAESAALGGLLGLATGGAFGAGGQRIANAQSDRAATADATDTLAHSEGFRNNLLNANDEDLTQTLDAFDRAEQRGKLTDAAKNQVVIARQEIQAEQARRLTRSAITPTGEPGLPGSFDPSLGLGLAPAMADSASEAQPLAELGDWQRAGIQRELGRIDEEAARRAETARLARAAQEPRTVPLGSSPAATGLADIRPPALDQPVLEGELLPPETMPRPVRRAALADEVSALNRSPGQISARSPLLAGPDASVGSAPPSGPPGLPAPALDWADLAVLEDLGVSAPLPVPVAPDNAIRPERGQAIERTPPTGRSAERTTADAEDRARLAEMMGPRLSLPSPPLLPQGQEPLAPRPDEGRTAHPAIQGGRLAFPAETGTLGIPNAEIPQIAAADRGALVNFLKARGIGHATAEISPSLLRPSQAEFDPEKVAQAQEAKGGDRSILASSDGRVLDGHHQWLASLQRGEPVKVMRLDAPIDQLFDVVRRFPSATTRADDLRPASKPDIAPKESSPISPDGQMPDSMKRDADFALWPVGEVLSRLERARAADPSPGVRHVADTWAAHKPLIEEAYQNIGNMIDSVPAGPHREAVRRYFAERIPDRFISDQEAAFEAADSPKPDWANPPETTDDQRRPQNQKNALQSQIQAQTEGQRRTERQRAAQGTLIPEGASVAPAIPDALPDFTAPTPGLNAAALASYRDTTGWAERGGRLLRDQAGKVTGRSKWLPNDPWWQAYKQGSNTLDERAAKEQLQRAIDGKPLTRRGRQLLEFIGAYHRDQQVAPDLAAPDELTPDEQALLADLEQDLSARFGEDWLETVREDVARKVPDDAPQADYERAVMDAIRAKLGAIATEEPTDATIRSDTALPSPPERPAGQAARRPGGEGQGQITSPAPAGQEPRGETPEVAAATPGPAAPAGAGQTPAAPSPEAAPVAPSALTVEAARQELRDALGEKAVAALERSGRLLWHRADPTGTGAAGFVDPDGKMHLIPGNMDRGALAVAVHEAVHLAADDRFFEGSRAQIRLAHAGLRLFGLKNFIGGPSFTDLARQVRRLAAQGDQTALDAIAKARREDPNNADEESVAYLAQYADINKPLVQRVLAAIRAALYRMGLKVQLTADDVRALALSALKAQARNAVKERQAARLPAAPAYSLPDFAPTEADRAEVERQMKAVKEIRDAQGRLLAPNGAPSNLNERQWKQTRTPFFKDWFGDWEYAAHQRAIDAISPAEAAAVSGKTLQELNRDVLRYVDSRYLHGETRQFENLETRDLIAVSKTALRKAMSGHAGEQKMRAATVIPDLIRGAHKVFSAKDERGRPDIKAYHYYVAPVKIQGEIRYAKLVVRELTDGKKFYDHELSEVSGGAGQHEAASTTLGAQPSPPALDHIVHHGWQKFQGDVSKVVDDNGEPLAVFHGTSEDSPILSPSRSESEFGAFFTTSREAANEYADDAGGHVLPLFLNIRKPYRVTNRQWGNGEGLSPEEAYQRKYDGYLIAGMDGGDTWITFFENSAKSATGNAGTFSSRSPRTDYSQPATEDDAAEQARLWEEFQQIRSQFKEREARATAFERWFGEGTEGITARDGKALVLYHGTPTEFHRFDAGRSGINSQHPTSGLGFFMTADRGAAARYGSNVLELHAKIDKPYFLTDADLMAVDSVEAAVKFKRRLQEKGHDGAVVSGPGMAPYVIAFESRQVKLASNQNPTDSPDFRFSRSTPSYDSTELAADKNDAHAYRLAALTVVQSRYAGNPAVQVTIASTGEPVMVGMAGVKHALRAGKPNWQTSLAALHVEDLLRRSSKIGVEPDRYGRKDPIAIHRYHAQAVFDGVAQDVILIVREHSDGRRYYDHAVINDKAPAGLYESQQPKPSDLLNLNAGATDTITPSQNDKNRYSRPGRPVGPAELPAETKAQAFQRAVQDKFVRFQVVQDWVKKSGINLTPSADVYGAEALAPKKTAAETETAREKILKPLIARAAKNGWALSGGDLLAAIEDGQPLPATFKPSVGEYLHAAHAKERNAAIAKINPQYRDGGSGLTDAQADAILARYRGVRGFSLFERLAADFRGITDLTRSKLLGAGIISKETADAWRTAYSRYVPLKGGPEGSAQPSGTGPGISVAGRQRRALGHALRDENIVENIWRDHERAIALGHKQEVARALREFLRQANHSRIGTEGQPEKRAVLAQGWVHQVWIEGSPLGAFQSYNEARAAMAQDSLDTGRALSKYAVRHQMADQSVVYMGRPMLADNEVALYEDGQLVRLQLNDELLARAARNLGVDAANGLLKMGQSFNRWLSSAYTGYNPEFILTNVARDMTAGTINLTGKYGIKTAGRALAAYPGAVKALVNYLRTGSDPLIERYRAAGGSTGAAYLSDLERIGSDIKRVFQDLQGARETWAGGDRAGAVRVAAADKVRLLGGWIEKMNQVGENALRVATFKTLLDAGKSEAEAARAAGEVTVNFNRKGELTAQLGGLYLFFNPSVQGTKIMWDALFRGPHRHQAQALAGGLALLAFSIAQSARGGSDDDEKRWQRIQSYTKDRNLVIPIGQELLTIPVPYGYGAFWSLGNILSDLMSGEDGVKAGIRLASTVFEQFSPIGNPFAGDEASAENLLTFLPTAIKPAMSVAMNRTELGRPVMPEVKAWEPGQPDSRRMWRSTQGTMWERAAEAMNRWSGGDRYQGGLVDVSPETLKLIWTTFAGGAGQFATDAANLPIMMYQGAGETIKPREIPILRRFFKTATIQDARAVFNAQAGAIQEALATFNAARRDRNFEAARDIQSEHRELLALGRTLRSAQQAVRARRQMEDEIGRSDLPLAEKRRQLDALEQKEEAIYSKFHDLFLAAKQREAA